MLDKYVYGAHVRYMMHNSVLLLLIVLYDLTIYSNLGFNLHFRLKAKINKNAQREESVSTSSRVSLSLLLLPL